MMEVMQMVGQLSKYEAATAVASASGVLFSHSLGVVPKIVILSAVPEFTTGNSINHVIASGEYFFGATTRGNKATNSITITNDESVTAQGSTAIVGQTKIEFANLNEVVKFGAGTTYKAEIYA